MIDEDGDGVADKVHVVINDKEVPNGVAWREGSLFVAQIGYVWRYDNVDELAVAGKVRHGFQSNIFVLQLVETLVCTVIHINLAWDCDQLVRAGLQ